MSKRQTAEGIETRKRIYDFMKSYEDTVKISPSVREIKEGLGIGSTNTIRWNIAVMVENGDLVAILPEGRARRYRTNRKQEKQ